MSALLRVTLDRRGLGDFFDLLAASDIDASRIDGLTEADLRKIGLTLAQRKLFMRARSERLAQFNAARLCRAAGDGPPLKGERRQLTTMFCDLAGSAQRFGRLDPEDLSEVLRHFLDMCSAVISSGSGYVARYMGDGVLAYFGYPQARMDDAQGAVCAALEIAAKVGQLPTPDGEDLRVRIGIATGLVVVSELGGGGLGPEQSVVGETLNLAARLQGAAGPGEIVISEATRRLCGALFDYERWADIGLKGFPEPITVYRVLGESAAWSTFDARASAGMPLKGERRQLTAMFCDLVGSTEMSSRLELEDLSEVLCNFLDMCSVAITSGSGYVARYMGDGVLAYFGYPQAREDDAQGAARAALEIVAKVGQLRTPDGEVLRVRIGIATGLVVVSEVGGGGLAPEQSVVGETPSLAVRLQGAAAPGEIMISEATRRLCGALLDYERRADVRLNGFPEPITIYRVLSEGAAQSRFDARASAGLNAFVGRGRELDALRTLWSAARDGAGQVVLVNGEAGIGKSRLARAFIERIGHEPVAILEWNCAAHLANRPLHPIVREIETRAGLSRTLPAEARRVGLEALVAASPTLGADDVTFLADFLGITSIGRAELDAPTRARRTYDALARWVEGMTGEMPVLILIEDAHWADAATLDFLTMLIDRIERLPTLLLVTSRPAFTPPWRVAGSGGPITLDPLDAATGARLLNTVMRERRLPASVVRTILQKAGGVPLFVEELARTVLDAMSDHGGDPHSLAALKIPGTLQDSLMARLDQLGEIKELAQIGSVIGREFSAAMLRFIAPHHTDIEGGLRCLCDSGLTNLARQEDAGVIAFHHALVQDAAYESLLKKRRRELHRIVAEAMLAHNPHFEGAEPEVIARHCSNGGLAAPAVTHWLAAGLHALDRAANAPSVTYLRSALDQLALSPENGERALTELRIQMALAPATSAIYGWAAPEVETACKRAVELATAVGDREALCGATWGLWTSFFIRGEMNPALQTARTVAAMADETGSTLFALVAAHALTYTHYSRGEYREALVAGCAGVARYDPESDLRALQAFQLSPSLALPTLLANVHWFLGDDAEADAAMARAHAMAEALNHPPALVHCLCVSSYFLLFARQWARLSPIAEKAIRISVDEGFRFWEPMARISLAFVEAQQGDRDGAIQRIIENMRQFTATGASIVMSQFEPMLGELLIESGDPAQAALRLSDAIADSERRVERAYLPELYRVRSLARSALGDSATAEQDARTAVAIAAAQGAKPLIRRSEGTLHALLSHGGHDFIISSEI
ncbi:adenylate/guanylate cyclase domain-containing protein [Methylocapsa polymorpha]|uniref:Adenylate/guanylate cyclase domain-containing protein n=1 Tax=Methylocapsa polymorpha TaxID=3080828 RepID=A0ABZ0HVA2_9HYPH|nr:adenylate/guanylate cyclase domain-containing protein [Methylocapsa sp. RX1]